MDRAIASLLGFAHFFSRTNVGTTRFQAVEIAWHSAKSGTTFLSRCTLRARASRILSRRASDLRFKHVDALFRPQQSQPNRY